MHSKNHKSTESNSESHFINTDHVSYDHSHHHDKQVSQEKHGLVMAEDHSQMDHGAQGRHDLGHSSHHAAMMKISEIAFGLCYY